MFCGPGGIGAPAAGWLSKGIYSAPSSWQNNGAHDAMAPGCCQALRKSARRGFCVELDNGESAEGKASGWKWRCFTQSFLPSFFQQYSLSTYCAWHRGGRNLRLMEFKVSLGARCYDANNHTENNSFIIVTVARENVNRVMKALENPR